MTDTDDEYHERYVCRNCGVEPVMRIFVSEDSFGETRPERAIACECARLDSLLDLPDQWEVDS